MASREELLACIKQDMHLKRSFFKRVYGYEISCPGFADRVIAALEAVGCSKARQYYDDWVSEYEAAYRAEIQPVVAWYSAEREREWEKKQKAGEERRIIQEEAELLKRKKRLLMQKSQTLTGS